MNKFFLVLLILISCHNDHNTTTNETSFLEICGDGLLSPDEECDDAIDNNCRNCIKPRKIFVTDQAYTGIFKDMADDLCVEEADKINLNDYSWKAWISLDDENIKDKLYQSPFRYELLDGTIIANSYEELISGTLQHEINLNQFKKIVDVQVWTGSDEFGIYSNYNCNNWSSFRILGTVGSSKLKDKGWTNLGINDCINPAHLFCIEDTKL